MDFRPFRSAFTASSLVSVLLAASCDIYQDVGFAPGFYYESDGAKSGDSYEDYEDNPFIDTAVNNVSTFSVDADGASYANMRRFILQEQRLLYKSAIRIEEFLNYFTFDYPEPADGMSAAINSEVSPCPWNDAHMLLRLGIKGKSLSPGDMPLANYVFLIDVSGSMNSSDKLELLKKGLTTMVDYLNPEDRVSIITYAGTSQKLLESTLAKDSKSIKAAISKLKASGSTNGGDAMKMAYEEAIGNYIEGGNNRIVMGTDGDFNVGVTGEELIEMVEDYASRGIYLTVCGFGRGNLNDSFMEKVSNRGNGTYEYIDCEEEIMKVFVNERAKFHIVANDAKVQITFNPETVGSYRLIGYENRVMGSDDFEDDGKDAGEIGAGQTVTALYEIVPREGVSAGESREFGTFDFRYKEALGGKSIPLSCPIGGECAEKMSENMSFAAGTAAFGMILRESPYSGCATFEMAKGLVRDGMGFDPHGYRKQFLQIIESASKY